MTTRTPPELDDPRPTARGWAWRRGVTLVFALSTTITLVAGFFELPLGNARGAVAIAGMVSLASALVLWIAVRTVPSRSDRDLDERLREVRDRSFRYAFQFLAIAALAVFGVAMLQAAFFDRLPDVQSLQTWVGTFIALNFGTPSAVMAWTEPTV
jgi:uncharacterized membrane protein